MTVRAYDQIGDAGWQCVGLAEAPTAQLYRTMEILGCAFQLNAIRILEGEGSANGLQTPDPCSAWSLDQFANLAAAFGESGPWHTVTIAGREYVLLPEPFSGWTPKRAIGNVVRLHP
jgi:hypothetical protein